MTKKNIKVTAVDSGHMDPSVMLRFNRKSPIQVDLAQKKPKS